MADAMKACFWQNNVENVLKIVKKNKSHILSLAVKGLNL